MRMRLGVDADRMSLPLELHDGADPVHGIVEVTGPVDGEHQGELLVGERVLGSDPRCPRP